MILADKIIELRKKNGWSQEELAEKLEVSRQSISKWEGAQSVPDMNRIIKMSEIFGVSTDVLLKDELDLSYGSENTVVDKSSAPCDVRSVSMEEATAFLADRQTYAFRVALGVMLCILSPITLILLSGLSDAGALAISENKTAGIGLIILFLNIGCAVALFVLEGLRNKKYEYLSTEPIETKYGVDGMVKQKMESYKNTYHTRLVGGIVLCVSSVLPIFTALTFFGDENEAAMIVAVCVLLLFVAAGVFLIVSSATVWGGFNILLEEDDYSKANKRANKRNERFAAIYWPIITAGYLAYSFLTFSWATSWVIWPVAAVAYGGIIAILGGVKKED